MPSLSQSSPRAPAVASPYPCPPSCAPPWLPSRGLRDLAPEQVVHPLQVERFGVEARPCPGDEFIMLGVSWIPDGGHKLLIARTAAAVLGRAGTLPSQADRIAADT